MVLVAASEVPKAMPSEARMTLQSSILKPGSVAPVGRYADAATPKTVSTDTKVAHAAQQDEHRTDSQRLRRLYHHKKAAVKTAAFLYLITLSYQWTLTPLYSTKTHHRADRVGLLNSAARPL